MYRTNQYRRNLLGSRSFFSGEDIGFAVLFVVVAGFILSAVGFGLYSSFHTETFSNCKVEDKDRTSNDGKSDMRVYTTCGNFKVGDSWLSGTWHSSDTYREIKVGKTYDFDTRGIRVPLFSWFPNIIEAHEVK